MLNNVDLMAEIKKFRGKAIAIPTMTGSRGWLDSSEQPSRDVSVGGAMGKASNFAMGLALAQPDTKVVCFDGDGSLNMNLGTMMTIAGAKPKNLIHFVLNNGYFSVTGGQPIAAADEANFSQMAAGAGYAASYEFDNIEDFAGKVEEIFTAEGPIFVHIHSVPEIQNEPIGRRTRDPRNRSTNDAIKDLRKELGTL